MTAPLRPRFTVLMSVYAGDTPDRFERAINSVYANTVRPDAVCLVVDGPVQADLDRSIAAFAERHAPRVIRLRENKGLAFALNAGLAEIETEWAVRADADDYNLPDRFAVQTAAMTDDLDLVGGVIREVDAAGRRIALRVPPLGQDEIRRYARTRSPFNHVTVALRRSLVMECGGYPSFLRRKEDYGLWASMLQKGARCRNLSDILVEVTAGEDMYRRRGGLAYAASEISLQRHLVRCGLKPASSAFLHGTARAAIFLAPTGLRGWFYERFLRSQ